jgi:hypothetical protein
LISLSARDCPLIDFRGAIEALTDCGLLERVKE